MKEQSINKARLGAFVLAGTLLLVLGLYYIGSQKNIFNKTILVYTDVRDIGGLIAGNNVRFNGIDVGMVSKVYPVSDTAIRVEFTIDEETSDFISKDALVAIGTDGLLGNKIINILPGTIGSTRIEEGDILKSRNPVDMDSAMRTMNITNDNLKLITDNLKGITEKFNSNNSLWHLLTDTAIAANVRSALVSFQVTGENTAVISGDLSDIMKDIKAGKGTVGALLTDTLIYSKLNQTVVNIEAISDTVAIITGNFKVVSEQMRSGKGAFATLLTDTTFVRDLNQSMSNIKDGTGNFNQNMEALKLSWPFKKYFRQVEQKEKK